MGITFGFTNNGEGEIPRNNLALIRMARRNQGEYTLKHKGKILSYRKEQYQLKLEIKGLNKKLETELYSEAVSAKQLRKELRDYWISALEPGDYGSQKVYSPNGLGYTIPVLPPEPDWIKVDESEDEEWRNFWIKTLATELAFSVAFEIAIIRYADKVRLAANAANKVKLVNRCKAPRSGPFNLSQPVGAARVSSWTSRLEGTRLKQVGNYWIKEVDPNVSAFRQWWARGSLNAQAKALDRLGDMAPSHLYRNGKLVIRDVGEFAGTRGDVFKTWLRGSWRLRTPMNDIRGRNMGANGQIFDPAWHPIAQRAVEGGTIIVIYKGGEWIYLMVEEDQ